MSVDVLFGVCLDLHLDLECFSLSRLLLWSLPGLSLSLPLSDLCGVRLLPLFRSELLVGVDLLRLSLFGDGLLIDLPLLSLVVLGEWLLVGKPLFLSGVFEFLEEEVLLLLFAPLGETLLVGVLFPLRALFGEGLLEDIPLLLAARI